VAIGTFEKAVGWLEILASIGYDLNEEFIIH
jgi:hypothetical protein